MSIMFDDNYPGAAEERERRLDQEALERVRRRNLRTSDYRPDHDSLAVRFDHLQKLLEVVEDDMYGKPSKAHLKLQDAQVLARLIRSQVLK